MWIADKVVSDHYLLGIEKTESNLDCYCSLGNTPNPFSNIRKIFIHQQYSISKDLF